MGPVNSSVSTSSLAAPASAGPVVGADALSLDLMLRVQRGDIVVLHGAPELREVTQFTREYLGSLARRMFGVALPEDLSLIHRYLSPTQLIALFGHVNEHPAESAAVPLAVCRMLDRAGMADEVLISHTTHFRLNVPRADVGTVHRTPAHRDSWYRLPREGVNFWMPCTAFAGAGVCFYPAFFGREVARSAYNPRTYHHDLLEPLDSSQAVVPPYGESDCLIFSGEHLHHTQANQTDRTRVSWDYRVLPVRGLRASPRLHEFVLAAPFLHGAEARTQQAETQRALRSHGRRAAYWARRASLKAGRGLEACFQMERVLPNLGHYLPRALSRLRAKLPALPPWRRYASYPAQLLRPNEPSSAFRRCIAFLEGTDRKWKSRGSARGLGVGHYLEFGVWNGESMAIFWQQLRWYFGRVPRDRWKLYGFDSFVGLPAPRGDADRHPFVGEGSFRSMGTDEVRRRLRRAGCDEERVQLVPGMFEQSLTSELKERLGHPRASLVNIDVDFHSSTLTVLDWVEELLADGSLVYFDDVMFYNGHPGKGQLRAIAEFNRARSHSGLTPAPALDPAGRVYVYWRDERFAEESLQF
jgi:O-methyltransferase